MVQKFVVGDKVVNKSRPERGIGEVMSVTPDRYSRDDFDYGVAWPRPDGNGPGPAIPMRNHHALEKLDECTHYRQRYDACPACGKALNPDGTTKKEN